MGRFDPAKTAGRLAGAVRGTDWRGRATQAMRTLKDEYEAGRRGDDTPAQPIWASPGAQLDRVLQLLRGAREEPAAPAETHPPTDLASPGAERDAADGDATERDATDRDEDERDAADVAAALRGVDWAAVRAATAERSNDAARAVRAMAEQVDWAKVQPVATQVSTALIAAVASGQLGVGGRLGTTVARAIVDQGGLGQRVARRVAADDLAVPAELRHVIDTTAREG